MLLIDITTKWYYVVVRPQFIYSFSYLHFSTFNYTFDDNDQSVYEHLSTSICMDICFYFGR